MDEKEPILRVRMDPDLKSQFFEICRQIDQTPSQVVRAAIRAFVREHAQPDLPEMSKPARRRK